MKNITQKKANFLLKNTLSFLSYPMDFGRIYTDSNYYQESTESSCRTVGFRSCPTGPTRSWATRPVFSTLIGPTRLCSHWLDLGHNIMMLLRELCYAIKNLWIFGTKFLALRWFFMSYGWLHARKGTIIGRPSAINNQRRTFGLTLWHKSEWRQQ